LKISSVTQEIPAFLWCESLHDATDSAQQAGNGVLGGLAQIRPQFADGHLHRIEVGRVARQIEQYDVSRALVLGINQDRRLTLWVSLLFAKMNSSSRTPRSIVSTISFRQERLEKRKKSGLKRLEAIMLSPASLASLPHLGRKVAIAKKANDSIP
jgi:hypothetical protein